MSRVSHGLCLSAVIAAMGCAAEGLDANDANVGAQDVLAKRAIEAKAAEQSGVGKVTQALGVPQQFIHIPPRFFGGNIVEQDFFFTIPDPDPSLPTKGMCDPSSKHHSARAQWTGNGACEFIGWENPTNQRDCNARFHVHTNAFWGSGSCEMWIYQERAPAGSCRDPRGIRCGGAGSDNSCFCDEACLYYGDCCLDYGDHCG